VLSGSAYGITYATVAARQSERYGQAAIVVAELLASFAVDPSYRLDIRPWQFQNQQGAIRRLN
jgi:hypothetical protein